MDRFWVILVLGLQVINDFKQRPDKWQTGKVPAKERRHLFTIWSCDAVAELMKRPDIIRRAFRDNGVGIDIDGIMKNYLRFPGFETYIPPEKTEEHIDEILTEEEIQNLEKMEAEYQARKKKRKKEERETELR